MNRRPFNPAWLLLVLPLGYAVVWQLIGLIPVNAGAGWDGAVYLDYLAQWTRGQPIEGDPYRLTRLPGFLPAALALWLGLDRAHIPWLQVALNAALLSAVAALLGRTLLRQLERPAIAVWASGTLYFSWPYLVVPVFYPLLSDHLALVCAVLSLWAWFHGRRTLLAGLGLLSVWIMPGLFVVPLALIALPFDAQAAAFRPGWRWPVFFLLAALAVAACWPMAGLSDEAIRHHPKGNALGLPGLKAWSIGVVLLGLLAVAALWTRLLSSPDFWRRIAWRPLIAAAAVVGLGGLSTWLVADWGAGFRGPALLDNLLLQAVAAPAKPLVAHVIYFGPVFLVALGLCLKPGALEPRAFPLCVLLTAVLPIFLMGSESRQWIGFLPVFVTLVALHERSRLRWRLLLGASVAGCLPFVTLAPALLARTTEPGTVGMGWWWYLAHHGPWMPTGAYLAGAVLAVGFALAYRRCRSGD